MLDMCVLVGVMPMYNYMREKMSKSAAYIGIIQFHVG